MACTTVPNPWNAGGNPFDPSLITITGINGISGGGDLTASRQLGLDLNSLVATATVDALADYVVIYDASVGQERKVLVTDLPFGAGTFNYFNSIYIDQSGGTADTYGILAGVIDGANTTFTVSQLGYDSGTLLVYLNGQLQTQGTGEDWTETTPASGTFDFATAPLVGDEITVVYQFQTVSTSTLLTIRNIQSVSTDYILLVSDQGAIVDASSLAVTITLPPASSVTGLKYFIVKEDSSINNVIVEGDGAELISGSLNISLPGQWDALHVISDGTRWVYI